MLVTSAAPSGARVVGVGLRGERALHDGARRLDGSHVGKDEREEGVVHLGVGVGDVALLERVVVDVVELAAVAKARVYAPCALRGMSSETARTMFGGADGSVFGGAAPKALRPESMSMSGFLKSFAAIFAAAISLHTCTSRCPDFIP